MKRAPVICHRLHKSFASLPVVRNLSFEVAPGQILALLGPSGCGKTTTLRLIAGFEKLDAGRIEIDGQLVAGEHRHLPPEKRRAGIVFQDYAIFPHLSVAGNVRFGLGRKGAGARAAEMLAFVGMEGMGERMPHELSGGQQQRVALARALAPDPAVLLLDEPFSNLDASLRVSMRQEVRRLLKQSRTTAIFVTHDQEEALFMGDRVAVMNDGRLEQIGTPEAIFQRPATRFVADFIGQTDFVPGRATARGVETPLGLLPQRLPLPEGAPVEVAVRPDDVNLAVAADEGHGSSHGYSNGHGVGHIVGRQFVGIAYIYKVGLPDGTVVHSWQPHLNYLAEGTAVQVRLTDEHDLICFHQGQAVHD